jgi:hypothetical protein
MIIPKSASIGEENYTSNYLSSHLDGNVEAFKPLGRHVGQDRTAAQSRSQRCGIPTPTANH